MLLALVALAVAALFLFLVALLSFLFLLFFLVVPFLLLLFLFPLALFGAAVRIRGAFAVRGFWRGHRRSSGRLFGGQPGARAAPPSRFTVNPRRPGARAPERWHGRQTDVGAEF